VGHDGVGAGERSVARTLRGGVDLGA
jgi:hypothetical protein